jgi:hypothetical protein
VTCGQLETLETELRAAFLPPSNIFQRLWQLLRRRQVKAGRRAACEPLLALPNSFVDHALPDATAPAEAWDDSFTTWKAWAVVPLLARSQRAVLVGDPMQLQHVSRLDVVIEQALLQRYELTNASVQRFTYRVNSAFDLADANPSVPHAARVRLDLHFRSHDLIADYCNEAFYARTLHVVTVTERLNIPRGAGPGIHWTHVAGRLHPAPTGAWCGEEVKAIRVVGNGRLAGEAQGGLPEHLAVNEADSPGE